jgi:hypothetical protein
VTQNVLARHARDLGLRWNTGKVGQFERGQYNPAFGTVLVVAYALTLATKRNVTLADLVMSDGFVGVTDEFDPAGEALRDVTSGQRQWSDLVADDVGYTARLASDPEFGKKIPEGLARRPRDRRYANVPTRGLVEILSRSGLDEERVAKRLGVNVEELAMRSWLLWRRAFSDERDSRAGPDANAQKRGRISRQLQGQLEEEFGRGHH